jgi:hypothetical protein
MAATQTKSPLALVKKDFGEKKKLVEALKALAGDDLWLGRTGEDRGGDKGLSLISNAKLLKLHATFKAVKDKFGTRAKLIDAIIATEKRGQDEGFKKRITAYPVPRLFDMWKSAEKRNAPKTKTKTKSIAPPAAKAKVVAPVAKPKAKPKKKKK